MQGTLRKPTLDRTSAPSQQNPGTTRLAMTEGRRRAALIVLQEYYRAVELGRAPID
jgi:hypothetical protein